MSAFDQQGPHISYRCLNNRSARKGWSFLGLAWMRNYLWEILRQALKFRPLWHALVGLQSETKSQGVLQDIGTAKVG